MFGWWNICWNLESKLLICCVNLFCFEVLSLESNIWNKKRNRFLALDECFSPQAFLQLRLSKWHFGCGSIDLWAGSELGYGPALMWLWNWIWGPLQKMRNKPVGLWPTATKILGGKPDSKATGFWKAASSLHVHSIYIFGSFEPFEFLSQIYSRWIGGVWTRQALLSNPRRYPYKFAAKVVKLVPEAKYDAESRTPPVEADGAGFLYLESLRKTLWYCISNMFFWWMNLYISQSSPKHHSQKLLPPKTLQKKNIGRHSVH